MAARGYKFYLLLLKVFLPLLFTSLTCERYFQHLKIKFVSLCGHVISYLFNSNNKDSSFFLRIVLLYFIRMTNMMQGGAGSAGGAAGIFQA